MNLSKNKTRKTVLLIYLYFLIYRDIVDAAHLTPLSKEDKMNPNTNKSRWNPSIG